MARVRSKTRLQADLVHQIKQNEDGDITDISTTENLTFSHLRIDGQGNGDKVSLSAPTTLKGDVHIQGSATTETRINSRFIYLGAHADYGSTIYVGNNSDDTVIFKADTSLRSSLNVYGTMTIEGDTTITEDATVTHNGVSVFNDDITLNGDLTADDATITGNLTIGQNLIFDSQTFTGTNRLQIQNVGSVNQFDAYGLST